MAQLTRETERKYATPEGDDIGWLSHLTGADPVASLSEGGVQELDAVYYDTADLRLTRTKASLRRRTGGTDAGWHLKLPLPGDSREEIQAPLSSEAAPPDELVELVLSRTRKAPLRPVIHIRSTRSLRHLLDAEGAVLADLSMDAVWAESLLEDGGHARWTELEVELANRAGPELLDGIEEVLHEHGVDREQSPSKVAHALAETTSLLERTVDAGVQVAPGSAGHYVFVYVDGLVEALTDLDPAVRRGMPDAVHRMRTTARRLRGCLRSYRSVLDREVTDPIRRDLKWLAGELGAERDHEVLRERVTSGLRELAGELVFGPVTARLQAWDVAQRAEGRRRTLAALASPRYLDLLEDLKILTAAPPLRAKAAGKPKKVLVKVLLKDYRRLARRMDRALDMPSGSDRDAAIHSARKAAKRLRYAAEAARPALGKPARRLGKRVKAVQRVSGTQHDTVVTCHALRRMAVAAQTAGEPGFTWGLLYGRERAAGRALERELPGAWARARATARRYGA
ncbi:CYTH and CHAD domain-containing protein [Streptomyces olivochromogenes]|uniref:CYTH and CHAD domain-containing protein n=1 Tax=Streptomyces olivochromogenes TaxID=1963 RepID=UPI001F29CAFB|nr:CYTH and CHAD domain-containing protein [Streptomyces olivochromogenes]MCF3134178.1 CYTH and CHAD domain-containing protein [Streptomyces olivochromogenes]